MSTSSTTQYKREIETYKLEIKDFITNRQSELEQDNGSILQEITGNINAISQGNDLIQINNTGNNLDNLQIDYEGLPDKIDEFTNLLKSLVSLYLKQESLDQFLRITISNNKDDILHINSVRDPRYRNLESQVKILKEDNVDEREKEIEQLRNNITSISQDILSSEERLDDLTKDTQREIYECEDLLKELNEIQEVRDQQLSKLENKEISEIQKYEDYITNSNKVISLTKEQNQLQDEITNLKSKNPTKKSATQSDEKLKQEIKQIQTENTVINKFIEIQENHLLSNFGHGITDFKFNYQDTKREIIFQYQDKYHILINLNFRDNTFENIIIQGNNNTNQLNILATDINNKFIHSNNIFHIINYTSDRLKFINL